MDRESSNFLRTLAVAILLHLVVGVGATKLGHFVSLSSVPSESSAPGEIAIEQLISEPEVAPAAIPAPPAPASLVRARPPVFAAEARANPEVEGSGTASPTSSLESKDPEPWHMPTAASKVDLGLEGKARWSTLDRNAVPGESTSGGVLEAVDARDRSLGLDAGGALTSLAQEVTRSGTSPVRGVATFDVVLDAEGHVTSVRVTGASAEREAWAKVANELDEALRKRALRVPAMSRGIAFALEIESRTCLASGHDDELQVSINAIPVHKGNGAKNPVKLGLVILPFFLGLGGSFDETDLAWKAQRRVTARITGAQRL